MRRKKKSFFAFVAFFLCCGSMAAQVRVMSLGEVMAAADSGSAALRAARAGVAASRQQAVAADRSILLPDVRVSSSVGYLGNGYGWGRDSSYSFTVPMPHFSTRFGVEAQQVVYAGGATTSIRNQAMLGVQMAELDEAQSRQDVRLQIACHYLDLYRAQCQMAVFDSNIAHTETMIANIRARRDQGTALRNDLTRYELQLAYLQMQRATADNDRAIASNEIVSLAGLPHGTVVEADSSFLSAALPSLATGREATIGVRRAEVRLSLAREGERTSRAAMLPNVALVAQDELNGPVTIDITPYNINYNYWFVGVALSYNLSSLWKQGSKLRSARLLTQQRQQEHQAVVDATDQAIAAATTRLDEAQRNLAVRRKSIELAEQNYTLVRNRYEEALAPLADMLDASNTKLGAELDLIEARLTVIYRTLNLNYLKGEL